MALMARFMRFVSRSGILSDARLLELYPPFVPMRIKVLEITEGWRSVRILLPLNATVAQSRWRDVWRLSGGAGGSHRGTGLRARISGLLGVDARHGDFIRSRRKFRPGDAIFSYAGTGRRIRIELERDGRSTPTFEYGYSARMGCAAR
jgi:hypothetical protein